MTRSGRMVLVWMVAAAGALPAAGTGTRAGRLSLEERVSAQAAIEGVYWRHRIWPADNAGEKPPLSQVLPEGAVRAAVENYLLESKALEQLWGRPIRSEDLQAEVERMVTTSHAPAVLEEIFAALGNDPILVSECLARPLLADRLIREAYARDPRYHQELKSAIERSLARRPTIAELRAQGEYAEAVWVLGGVAPERAARRAGGRMVRMDDDTWHHSLSRLQEGFAPDSMRPLDAPRIEDLPVGVLSSLQENDEVFFVQAILEKSSARLRVATKAWRKTPFDEWWAGTRAALASGSPDDEATTEIVGELDMTPSLPMPAATCTPDTWTPVQPSGAPTARQAFSSVWTGTELIVWGGYNGTLNLDTNTGGRYNPATNSWSATQTTNAPQLRDSHTAVWTGTRMVIWGGGDEAFAPKDTGGRYDPAMNTWQATSTAQRNPTARLFHTAVWSGSRMIVWGGWNGGNSDLDTGALYDPTGDAWTTVTPTGAPSPRDLHTAVWTGATMVVWGGEDNNAVPQNTGGRYNPAGNSWSATSLTNVPAARWMHTAVWTGSRMIVWGGFDGNMDVSTGGIYDPGVADTWAPTSDPGAPAPRELHVAVWADNIPEMIVWGGQNDAAASLSSGGRYNPATGIWQATSDGGAPLSGRYGCGIWTGSEMIVWGGWNASGQTDLRVGGRYCDGACAAAPPGGSSAISVNDQTGGNLVSWTAVAGADTYDLVRGSLDLLASSGGNFTTATQACLANDQTGVSFPDSASPAVGSGFWYLVRGTSCGGPGTYDSVGGAQVGSRDAEINAAASHCP
jgi:hypothetical protein